VQKRGKLGAVEREEAERVFFSVQASRLSRVLVGRCACALPSGSGWAV